MAEAEVERAAEMMVRREEQWTGREAVQFLERVFIVTVRMAAPEERKRADSVIEAKSLE